MSITVIGEAILDRVVREGIEERAVPGGSPLNVSIGLARLGHSVKFATQIGADAAGSLILTHLNEERLVTTVNEPGPRTGSATAVLHRDGSARYDFHLEWDIRLGSRAAQEALDVAGVIHTGSLGALYGAGGERVLAEIESRARGAVITFDPNCRPSATPDRDLIRSRVEQFVAIADVVKASDEDLLWLYPDLNPALVMAKWIGHGAALVVVTRGGANTLAMTRSLAVQDIPAARVEVQDTIGAGDSFMAALISGLATAGVSGVEGRAVLERLPQESLTHVLHRSALAAAITCTRTGAQPPTTHELAEFAASVVPDPE
jgi:fructokinase